MTRRKQPEQAAQDDGQEQFDKQILARLQEIEETLAQLQEVLSSKLSITV